MSGHRYEDDYYAWTREQADFLRAGRLADLDKEHLIEELDSMGARDYRELISRLAILIQHLIKWENQPDWRSKSWALTIIEQRAQIAQLFEQSPSLKARLTDEALRKAYRRALVAASTETGLEIERFPSENPNDLEMLMDSDYWPE